jgi:hypothetical protein
MRRAGPVISVAVLALLAGCVGDAPGPAGSGDTPPADAEAPEPVRIQEAQDYVGELHKSWFWKIEALPFNLTAQAVVSTQTTTAPVSGMTNASVVIVSPSGKRFACDGSGAWPPVITQGGCVAYASAGGNDASALGRWSATISASSCVCRYEMNVAVAYGAALQSPQ